MSRETLAIGFADVQAAEAALLGVALETPVFTSRAVDAQTAATVYFKAENLQRGGSFKFRGAYNRIASMSDEERERGVAAFSSGNHAQAVALAARLHDTRATILMPDDAPQAKVEATAGYGAEIVTYDRYTQDREVLGSDLAAERGLTLVPPYEDPLVMAGQGTATLELFADAGELDLLVVPVGGGGLIAGSSTAGKALNPRLRVVGVEPEAADDTRRSLETGGRVRIDVPRTIADGLQSPTPGKLTFEVNRRRVDEIVTVTDDEILDAMVFLFDRLKLVVEPSGAVAVAALLTRKVAALARTGAIISGGNVGAARFAELVSARSRRGAG
jgi:threonine dehydratase